MESAAGGGLGVSLHGLVGEKCVISVTRAVKIEFLYVLRVPSMSDRLLVTPLLRLGALDPFVGSGHRPQAFRR